MHNFHYNINVSDTKYGTFAMGILFDIAKNEVIKTLCDISLKKLTRVIISHINANLVSVSIPIGQHMQDIQQKCSQILKDMHKLYYLL